MAEQVEKKPQMCRICHNNLAIRRGVCDQCMQLGKGDLDKGPVGYVRVKKTPCSVCGKRMVPDDSWTLGVCSWCYLAKEIQSSPGGRTPTLVNGSLMQSGLD